MFTHTKSACGRWSMRIRGRYTLAFCAVGALGISAAAQAQQQPSQQQIAQGSEDSTSLGEIVVTARRQSERARDVPITIATQTEDQLVKAGVTDTRALGTAVPGLVISGQGAFFQPSLRGVSGSLVQAGAGNPVAVYLDGIYQPNLIGDLFDLPDVQRVEVLKGPQGTLFGRNASAGAISVYTKDPTLTPSGSISVGDGVYFGGTAHTSNDFTTKLNLSGPLIGNVLAGSISGYYNNVPGYLTDAVNGGATGSIMSYVYRGKLLFTPTDDLKFVFTAYRSSKHDNADSAVAAYRGVTVASLYPGAIIPDKPWHIASELHNSVSTVATQQTGASIRAEWDTGLGTLSSLTGYTHVYSLYLAEVDGAYAPACVAVFACITPYLVKYGPDKTLQEELTFSSKQLGRVKFVAGLFYYHDDADYGTAVNPPLDSNGYLTRAQAPYYTSANDTTTAYAAFGEANTDVTDSLHVITGIRYSWERQEANGSVVGGPVIDVGGRPHWTSWTPRVSIRYDINDHANVYATYSKGFKSGVLDTISLTPNVAQPETLNSYEIGSKFGSPDMSLNVSFFYYDYKDLQVQFLTPNASTVIGNAQKSTLYGLDFDGTFRLPAGFQLHTGISWLPHATYDTLKGAIDYDYPLDPFTGLKQVVLDASGHRMLRAPRFTGNVALQYEHQVESGQFDANAIVYDSSSYSYDYLDHIKSSAIVTIGGGVGFRPSGSKFHFSVWGKNLTNRTRVNATTTSGEANTVVYSPPREVGVTVDYAF